MACGFDRSALQMVSVLDLIIVPCVCNGGSGDTCWRVWGPEDVMSTTDSQNSLGQERKINRRKMMKWDKTRTIWAKDILKFLATLIIFL